VPFFRKNLILIGAQTGQGKSTAVANIAFRVKDLINPETGKRRKTLVLTNEERAEDVYNRITSLHKEWAYTNHSAFTDEQTEAYRKYIPIWAADGVITVIDNTHGGSHGVTTSLEGIETVFENLIKNKIYYDCVIIDYYQNIITSKKDAGMSENDVQARLSRMLDRYKNQYPAPIILLCQMKPMSENDRAPWQERIKGRKIIGDVCTFVCEMDADFDDFCTIWSVWKSRFAGSVGKTFKTGWDKGRYVQYTEEFALKINKLKEDRQAKEFDKKIGMTDVKPKGDAANDEKSDSI
jgi:DnaB-like helicase C terminal domain